jgi:non-specific protein-tyrosine kinase
MYAASVTMVVSADGEATGPEPPAALVQSYARLVPSDRVAAAVVDRLGLAESPNTLRDRISAQAVPGTLLLRVTVRDRRATTAAAAADAVGAAFATAVGQLEPPGPASGPQVTLWEPAATPARPVTPRPVRNLALGTLLGLLAGLAGLLVRRGLDPTLADEQEAAVLTGGPTLGSIAFEPDAGRRPLIVHVSPQSPRAEGFRQLRTNLRFAGVDGEPRSIVVTSAVAAEGRTTACCNLAITLAQDGARVCLVEGDLGRPSFAEYLGVDPTAGLTSVLIGAADLTDVLRPWDRGRFGAGQVDVLPSGPTPPNPAELVGSRAMAQLIDRLTGQYDLVLVDAPSLLGAGRGISWPGAGRGAAEPEARGLVTPAAVLASRVGGTLLVARPGRTRRGEVRRATAALRAVDARVLGNVLTMVPAGNRRGGSLPPGGAAKRARARVARRPPAVSAGNVPATTAPGSAPAGPADEPVSLTSIAARRSSAESPRPDAVRR